MTAICGFCLIWTSPAENDTSAMCRKFKINKARSKLEKWDRLAHPLAMGFVELKWHVSIYKRIIFNIIELKVLSRSVSLSVSRSSHVASLVKQDKLTAALFIAQVVGKHSASFPLFINVVAFYQLCQSSCPLSTGVFTDRSRVCLTYIAFFSCGGYTFFTEATAFVMQTIISSSEAAHYHESSH